MNRGNSAIIVWMQIEKGAIQTDSRPPCDTTPSEDVHLYVNARIDLRNAHNDGLFACKPRLIIESILIFCMVRELYVKITKS